MTIKTEISDESGHMREKGEILDTCGEHPGARYILRRDQLSAGVCQKDPDGADF